ncbi:MAG: cell division protein FtsL [Ruminiclostridium sp.]|nr:cell division protein FtsL [Ruminiclostridium sp.]
MYNDNSNLAYDLTLFETDEDLERRKRDRKKQREEQAKINITQKKSVGRNGSAVAAIALVAFAAVIAFSLLYSKVQISDYTSKISETKNEIELAERENVRLNSELDSMYTLDNVESIASQDLGLQKTQNSQITFITLNTEEMTEIAESDPNIFVSIQKWFNSILDYLGF